MSNCYRVCGEDFEGTVEMVASARDREIEEVKKALTFLKDKYGDTEEFQKIRSTIPQEFPF